MGAPAGTTSWPAPTTDTDGYPQDQVVNIQLVNGKLVDIDASGLTAGSINTWVNNGAYGGSFKTSSGGNPTAGLVGYYKAVTFTGGTGMMLRTAGGVNIPTDAFLSGNPTSASFNGRQGDGDDQLRPVGAS